MENATAFVTGASRGLGEATVRSLLNAGFSEIVGISRSRNESLAGKTGHKGATVEWVTCDLGSPADITGKLGPVFDRYNTDFRDPIVLINNAGVVEPIGPLGSVDSDEAARNIHVNLAAPLVLCNEFLRAFSHTRSRRIIVNITSGLARRAMSGVASYSSAKAGLDMLTEAIATEQSQRIGETDSSAPPVEVYAVSPGTVATQMQSALRASTEAELPDRSKFVSLFERGELYTPEYSSGKIVELILNPTLDSGSVTHVRDL
ncbi:MAG: SDR family NAD(P)-dependent oxidoreductase [Spirochaetales bacterium]